MSGDPIDWDPARMLRERAEGDDSGPRFALILLNQPLTDVAALETLWRNASLKVAADGGANRVLEVCEAERAKAADAGHHGSTSIFDHLDIIIGDLDSLTPAARAHFSSTRRPRPARIIHDRDQESTDFGKAVHHIRARNNSTSTTTTTSPHPPHPPLDIVAVGGLGGRVDQALSLLHHLHLFQADPAYAEGRLYLVSDESLTFLLKTGRHRVRVRGAAGDAGDDDGGGMFDKYVGIVPVGEPSVISTSGLEWDVTDWRTEFGGRVSTSNHVLPETEVVEVRTTKDVLFTIALKK